MTYSQHLSNFLNTDTPMCIKSKTLNVTIFFWLLIGLSHLYKFTHSNLYFLRIQQEQIFNNLFVLWNNTFLKTEFKMSPYTANEKHSLFSSWIYYYNININIICNGTLISTWARAFVLSCVYLFKFLQSGCAMSKNCDINYDINNINDAYYNAWTLLQNALNMR